MGKLQEAIFEQYASDCGRIFYRHVMGDGSDHIHYGLYTNEQTPIAEAVVASSHALFSLCLKKIEPASIRSILDLGAGAGGATKCLLNWTDAAITCFDLSAPALKDLLKWAESQGITHRLTIKVGSFDQYPENWQRKFDVVWSQDAMCHSEDRKKLFTHVKQSLQPNGVFAFTDILLADNATKEQIKAFSSVNALPNLGKESAYIQNLKHAGFESVEVEDWTLHLKTNFKKMLHQIITGKQWLLEHNIPEELISKFAEALKQRIAWPDNSPMELKAFICK